MSAALKRVEKWVRETHNTAHYSERSEPKWLTTADLRAVLALARRTEELEAALIAVAGDRDFRVRCDDRLQLKVDAALAPKPRAKTKRKPMFTPKQERIIRECELGDEMPPRAKQGER